MRCNDPVTLVAKCSLSFLLTGLLLTAGPRPPAKFRPITVGTGLKGGYMVAAVDMNADGKMDLIALAEGLPELVWYENPNWQRHVITSGVSRMIAVAAADLNHDGIPEIVLAHGFNTVAPKSAGILLLLTHNGDPRQPWTAREFDRVPTTHRIRFLDPAHDGNLILADSPLVNLETDKPGFADHVPIFIYKPGEWKRQEISREFQGNLHGMNVVDWNGDGRQGLLTACATGLHLVSRGKTGAWTVERLSTGNAEAWPRAGSSEAVLGHLGKRRLLAAIEPWHGNIVVVYRQNGARWERQVLDESLVLGHAITVGDFNGDGLDEVVAGYRGKGQSVYLYSATGKQGTKWTKQVLDDGDMAAGSCVVADFNADRRPDIACIGDRTANLKIYQNTGN
ncbi:MAG: VCBS repeat-containing protein [Acidobacteria bacterium]|nr:VCBS repeat-containing protein [Acidobacteriota bacterium]